MASEMQNIDIRDFTTVSTVETYDHVVISLFGGTSAKMKVSLLRDVLVRGITPSIGEDGTWYVGEATTGVTAEGKIPEFRKGTAGIEYKYTFEEEGAWRTLVSYSELRMRYEDLTEEQVKSLKLSFSDLTQEDIKELQKPAEDMISRLEETDNAVKEAEALRAEAETGRSEAEQERAQAEQERKEAEGFRESSEKDRESAETARALEEDIRAGNEELRILSEDFRSESEAGRKSAESARESGERTRISQENARVTAENARVAAESSRVSAEEDRVEEFARLKSESETAASGANTAAEEANTAKDAANAAAQAANESAEKADASAGNADAATARANTAADNAETAASDVNTAKDTANAAAQAANESAANADASAGKADNATVVATEAAANADNAASGANTAADTANDAAVNANAAADTARQSASAADESAEKADTAALAARNLPKIRNGTWWLYDIEQGIYVDSGYAVNTEYQLTREKVEEVLTGEVESHRHDRYVDKEEGKQLSTEDFTTVLKEKLEGLNNYDDAQISGAVEKLRADFDTLVNGDTADAIESFNEVVAFLEGLEDTQSLSSIIASVEQQIGKKADSDLLPTKVSQLENDIPYATASELASGLSAKQGTIEDLASIRSGRLLARRPCSRCRRDTLPRRRLTGSWKPSRMPTCTSRTWKRRSGWKTRLMPG